jgi:hypothetical protein
MAASAGSTHRPYVHMRYTVSPYIRNVGALRGAQRGPAVQLKQDLPACCSICQSDCQASKHCKLLAVTAVTGTPVRSPEMSCPACFVSQSSSTSETCASKTCVPPALRWLPSMHRSR